MADKDVIVLVSGPYTVHWDRRIGFTVYEDEEQVGQFHIGRSRPESLDAAREIAEGILAGRYGNPRNGQRPVAYEVR
jgi:hypothetical protein